MKHGGDENAQAISEISAIEEQLNGVEKYAMYFLEEENADFAAEQLRLAEVFCLFIFILDVHMYVIV